MWILKTIESARVCFCVVPRKLLITFNPMKFVHASNIDFKLQSTPNTSHMTGAMNNKLQKEQIR